MSIGTGISILFSYLLSILQTFPSPLPSNLLKLRQKLMYVSLVNSFSDNHQKVAYPYAQFPGHMRLENHRSFCQLNTNATNIYFSFHLNALQLRYITQASVFGKFVLLRISKDNVGRYVFLYSLRLEYPNFLSIFNRFYQHSHLVSIEPSSNDVKRAGFGFKKVLSFSATK